VAHVLVIGASRGIGREAVKAALGAGHRVRAFSRSVDQLDVSHLNLETRRGDALNPVDVDGALEGVDVVIQALGVRARDLMAPVRLFSESTRILVSAMEKRAVRLLISVTGFGAGDSRNAIGCLQRVPFRFFSAAPMTTRTFRRARSKIASSIGQLSGRAFSYPARHPTATEYWGNLRNGVTALSRALMWPILSSSK